MEQDAQRLGHTQAFIRVILDVLVSNAPEHSTAVMVAMKNKMDLAYGIAAGSSLQRALLIAPMLVFANDHFGPSLDLILTPFEVAAVTISVLIVGCVAMDGGSNWMEGAMLVGAYLMLAIAFVFLPALQEDKCRYLRSRNESMLNVAHLGNELSWQLGMGW